MISTLRGPASVTLRVVRFLALAVLTGLAPAVTQPLSAQAHRPTVVAIPDAFPDVEARSVLVRTAERDVVLLRDGHDTPDALLMATALLRKLSSEGGAPKPGTAQMIPITGFVVLRDPAPGHRRRVEDAIRRVRVAPVSDLGSVGLARWIEYPGR